MFIWAVGLPRMVVCLSVKLYMFFTLQWKAYCSRHVPRMVLHLKFCNFNIVYNIFAHNWHGQSSTYNMYSRFLQFNNELIYELPARAYLQRFTAHIKVYCSLCELIKFVLHTRYSRDGGTGEEYRVTETLINENKYTVQVEVQTLS